MSVLTETFTIVFEGDIRKLPFNPYKADTVFGRVVAAGVGNAFEIDLWDDPDDPCILPPSRPLGPTKQRG